LRSTASRRVAISAEVAEIISYGQPGSFLDTARTGDSHRGPRVSDKVLIMGKQTRRTMHVQGEVVVGLVDVNPRQRPRRWICSPRRKMAEGRLDLQFTSMNARGWCRGRRRIDLDFLLEDEGRAR
jgi:hypothetical protein